jgi:hypothetical protein
MSIPRAAVRLLVESAWSASERKESKCSEMPSNGRPGTVWTEIEAGKPVFVAKPRLVRKPR